MDLKKKLELLVKYDFSAWRKGFSQEGLYAKFDYILETADLMKNMNLIERISLIPKLEENYKNVFETYNQINFDELDETDEDFKFFFDYGVKIVELGQEINNLENEIISGKDISLDKLKGILKTELNGMNYTKMILTKYGLKNQRLDWSYMIKYNL